jgi:hypothetical protein
MINEEHPPFRIESPTKITLGPEARQLAAMNGMSEVDMARHLLQQHALREAGHLQKDGQT